ncbi:metallophosphatase domain-containing protein [Haloflavibacter putidus]|uniref:Metallophosphoesterase n=1 Tax=Haloflavibacter putidus TaxID=2576776 RepID=A0A507ZST7_9FLAO|nr:metallophosphatase domain-containing protein [Haloflavibacter putidus]TQD39601.1 metallophosphoesterase [Haloflavibacter putidus]
MNIICISDTHNQHRLLNIPYGEVLVHTGDFTEGGTKREVVDFFKWFAQQPHPYKVCIAGNHEFYLEKINTTQLAEIIPSNVHYLFQSSICIENVKFWGSPYSPINSRWAFSKTSNAIAKHWEKIPQDTDVLLTHTPPYNILDESEAEVALGCEHLRKRVEKIQPQFHIFGHLHNNYGKISRNKITYVNATSFNKNSKLINSPIKLRYLL